jgi:multidrug efflux pump subunit AcrA (membrane-fusion protein)
VLTVFLVTFIGIIDVGTVLFRMQGLTERARAGARWGVVNTYNATNIRNVVVYGNPNGTGGTLLGLADNMVTVSQVDLDDGLAQIRVRIENYPLRLYTPFIAGAWTFPRVEVSLTTESLGAT